MEGQRSALPEVAGERAAGPRLAPGSTRWARERLGALRTQSSVGGRVAILLPGPQDVAQGIPSLAVSAAYPSPDNTHNRAKGTRS